MAFNPSPDEKKANQEGYDARMAGKPQTRNPYPSHTNEHLSWNDGWDEADVDLNGDGD